MKKNNSFKILISILSIYLFNFAVIILVRRNPEWYENLMRKEFQPFVWITVLILIIGAVAGIVFALTSLNNKRNKKAFKKDFYKLVIIVFLPTVVLLSVIGYINYSIKPLDRGQVCTEEAKLCSDGTYVARSGPYCEFSECPSVGTEESLGSWKVMNDEKNGIILRYPESLSSRYVSAYDWPPKIQVLDELFSCTEAGSITSRAGITSKRNIFGNEYCVTEIIEGAAGSIYQQYAYAFPKDNKTIIFTFSLKVSQCGNYGENQKNECEQERLLFDIGDVIDLMRRNMSYQNK